MSKALLVMRFGQERRHLDSLAEGTTQWMALAAAAERYKIRSDLHFYVKCICLCACVRKPIFVFLPHFSFPLVTTCPPVTTCKPLVKLPRTLDMPALGLNEQDCGNGPSPHNTKTIQILRCEHPSLS